MLEPEGMTRMIQNKKAVVSQPFMIPNPDDKAAVAEAEIWCQCYDQFIPLHENCLEPLSYWYYPIVIDTSINDMEDFNGVKGMISRDFYWRDFLKDMLPPESRGIVVVFSNTCSENAFTYQINGPTAVYVSRDFQKTFHLCCCLVIIQIESYNNVSMLLLVKARCRRPSQS
jgi:hypothetical protein